MENREQLKNGPKEILDYQKTVREIRAKVARAATKNIFVISGDQDVRALLKSHFDFLEFPTDKLKISDSSAEVISRLKQNASSVDMIICHLKSINSRISSQTGIQLMKIVQDIVLNSSSEKTIPFLMMESEFEKKDILPAVRAGVAQFIILPSNPVSFGSKIVEAFGKPAAAPSSQFSGMILEGNKLREQGDFDSAISIYNKALAEGGENAEILVEKGSAFLMAGDVENAILAFKRAIEIERDFPRAYQGLGEAHYQLGNFDEAKKNFLKVVELEPNNVQAFHHVGTLFQEEGDYDSAAVYFTQGAELNPRYVKNYLGLAKNFDLQNNAPQALKVYQTAIAKNPSVTVLYVAAGDFCLKHDMDQIAEEIFGKALGLNETHLHLYNRLGMALRKQGKYAEAIENYNKGIKISPDDPNLRYNLAKAHYIRGDEMIAVEHLLRALKLDSGLMGALEKDQQFSRVMQQYPEKFSRLEGK